MITLIVIVVAVLAMFAPGNSVAKPETAYAIAEQDIATEWRLYWEEARQEYADEFTALFNSYEVKHAKNGALMIRTGTSGSYRFAKKGV